MTQPGPQGYPDWQRVGTLANVLYVDTGIGPVTGTTAVGPFFVGTQAAIGVYMEVVTGGFRYRFRFYDSEAKTTLLSSYVFDLANHNVVFTQVIPTLGPWLEIEMITDSLAGFANLTVWGATLPASIATNSLDNTIFSRTNTAIGAGITDTVYSETLWPGEAFLNFQQTAGTCVLTVYSLQYDGTSFPIWRRALTAGQSVGEKISLTTGSLRADIQNTSGAATSYYLYMFGTHTMLG